MIKKLTFFLIFNFIILIAFGQQQLSEQKTFYIGNNKIYINKKQPLKICLKLPNGDMVQLKDSFYLDTEGINYLRTKWEVDSAGNYTSDPKREKLWPIYADGYAPKTTVEFKASQKYEFKGKTYYSDDVEAILSASDVFSGVKKIYYSINGQPFSQYVNPINFPPSENINLKFYAVDNVGNIEKIKQINYQYDNNNLNFAIDNTPPTTTIFGLDSVISLKDTIRLVAEDKGVGVNGIFYKIDSNSLVSTKNFVYLSGLKEGEHIIQYYSLDWINNKEETKTQKFYLDLTPPEIKVLESVDDKSQYRNIDIQATDNKAGVNKIFVQIDLKKGYIEYNKPFLINITNDQLKIKAIDNVGNFIIRTIQYSTK